MRQPAAPAVAPAQGTPASRRPRLTASGAASLLAAVLMHLLARTTGDRWLALASAAFLAAPVVSLLLRPDLSTLQVQCRAPLAACAGEPVLHAITLTNDGRRSLPPVRWVAADLGGAWADEPAELRFPALGPGESSSLELVRHATRRGVHPPHAADLEAVGAFGMVRARKHVVRRTAATTIWPRVQHARPLPGGATTSYGGQDGEVLGLRPYRPGDPPRAVAARASAKRGSLVVLEREREVERHPGLVVLVSGGPAGEQWEADVAGAAESALTALRDGHPVTLLAGTGGPVARRPLDQVAVLDFFAAADASGALDASTVPVVPGRVVLRLGPVRG